MARGPNIIGVMPGGGMRNIVVGGPGGSMGSCGPLPGGLFDDEEEEPIKKFTSSDALQALMDAIKDDPSLIQNHISLVTSDQTNSFRKDFMPAVFDASQWTRTATHRPTHDDQGEKLCGTDREVREYENDYWMDNSRSLSGEVTTEFGEIIDIKVKCSW